MCYADIREGASRKERQTTVGFSVIVISVIFTDYLLGNFRQDS